MTKRPVSRFGVMAVAARIMAIFSWRPQHTPLRPQFQTTECGVGVLRTMLAHFGKQVSADEVRRVSGVSRDCLNAADIRRTARAFGLICDARTVETADLINLQLPVIVHLRFIHFVVLEHIDEERVRLNCPAAGIMQERLVEFNRSFTGIMLNLRPGPKFQRDAHRAAGASRWWINAMGRSKVAVTFAAFFALLQAAAVVVLGRSTEHRAAQAALFSLVAIAGAGAAAGLCLQLGKRRLYETLRVDLVRHLRTVGPSFWAYRLPEVLFDVISSAQRIGDRVFKRILPAGLAVAELAVLLVGAFLLDRSTAMGLATIVALWCGIVLFLTKWRRLDEKSIRSDVLNDVAAAYRGIENQTGTKLGDGPDEFRLCIEGNFAHIQFVRNLVGDWPRLLPGAPFALSFFCLLFVFSRQAASGSLLTGGFAILSVALGAAASPIARMRGVFDALQKDVFLMRDVLDEPAARPSIENSTARPQDASHAVLRLDSITFGFNPRKPPTLRDVSLTVAPGEQLGITGPSGEGKSTLTELMVGLHKPHAGQVLLGGLPIFEVAPELRARWIARVDRSPILFAGTLRDNLLLGDESISAMDLSAAVRDAALEDVLAQLPLGLDTLVEHNGRNFSGGQLQRIEIARALARNPHILILDDAVDALDLATELRIRDAVRRRQCSLILVSHRASSLTACDRVLRFAGGEIGREEKLPSEMRHSGLSIFGQVDDLPCIEPAIGPHAVEVCDALGQLTGCEQRIGVEEIAALPRIAAIHRWTAAHGVSFRPIHFLAGSWWRRDFGHVLAFRTDGTPVPLISRWQGNRIIGGGDIGPASLSDAEIAALDRDAYVFSRPEARVPATTNRWARRLLSACAREFLPAAVIAAIAAFLVCLLLYLAARPLKIRTLGTGVLLAAALVVFWSLRQTAIERVRVQLTSTGESLLQALLMRFDPDAARNWLPRRVMMGLAGLSGLTSTLLQMLDRGSMQFMLLLATLVAVALVAGRQAAFLVLAACAMCSLLPPALAFLSRRWQR
ncbi:MAG: ATP-binding cassette domain-containing protein, partial [Terriglobia bacterium]